jgi:ABC-2 type transport system permease protein
MTAFAGTGQLLRLIIRRDRWLLLVWIAITAVVPIGVAASFKELYPTVASLREFAALSMGTPSAIAVLGLVYSPTIGGLLAWRTGLNTAFFVAPVAVLFVVRHTRKEEESGRTEIVLSAAVGRFAPLTAALAEMLLAGALIGAFIAGGVAAQGLPVAGSIALGLSGATIVWMFAAAGGLAAQVTESPGAARGLGLAFLAAAWVLRAIGDVTPATWLSWVSPLGWARATRAFAGEQWWVFLLPLGFAGVVGVAAYMLSARRDIYGGLLPARLGPPTAAPGLRTPLALALRIDRATMIGWAVAGAGLGALLGSVASGIGGYLNDPSFAGWANRMGATGAGSAFFFLILYVVGQVLAAYSVSATLRMRAEEAQGRADMVLATAVGRLRWAGSHLASAVIGSAVIVAMLGLTTGLTYGLSVGDVGGQVATLLGRALTMIPAIWVMVGIATALYGLAPRLATPLTWALFGFFLLLELGWELHQVSSSVFAISPFAWVHWAIPVSPVALLALTAAGGVLVAAGLMAFARRDIAG